MEVKHLIFSNWENDMDPDEVGAWFDDEYANLDITVPEGIVIFADLGLWHGRCIAWRYAGTNVHNCLNETCGDLVTWYLDERGDLCCDDTHHDGTNYYVCRRYRPGITPLQRCNLRRKISLGTLTRRDITRYTESLGPLVRPVYGF